MNKQSNLGSRAHHSQAGPAAGIAPKLFCLGLCAFAWGGTVQASSRFVLSCNPDNDLLSMLEASGVETVRLDRPADAIATATEGEGVLILARNYPDRTTSIEADLFALAAKKSLRLYVEYPGFLPGTPVEPPRVAGKERAVVASDFFGAGLPRLRILSPQNCTFLPLRTPQSLLVLARVAGYDRALYGLPKEVYPLLFELPPGAGHGNVLVATTKLSQPARARFGPIPSWQTVWHGILAWLAPDRALELKWAPTVHPVAGREDPLPSDCEERALGRGCEWFVNSRLLLAPSRTNEVARRSAVGTAPTPPPAAPAGDGSLGILEGYSSNILPDGSQLQSVALRGDCQAESAMALSFGSRVFGRPQYADTARRLLDHYYFSSAARQGERGDPKSGAFGLIAWGVGTPSWLVANYGDDNARLLLGTMATAALLGENRWDEAMLECLLANLRTTGQLGFRGSRIDMSELKRNGWEYYFRRRLTHYAPHYESYLWACYLWAYQKTGYKLFLERARSAIGRTMAVYPEKWRWTNGMQQERARMLLCLAWLIRIEDTPEHRGWLRRIAEDLLAWQDASGAIQERIGRPSQGQLHPPGSNAAYGTGESPLLQENGDPVCDLLYTSNFAFLGLHEAAAATGDSFYARAEDRLARFLCRIQVRSKRHPELDGGWFRAFDFRLWDYWASNADAGWGAWSIETGWTEGWITSVLALRQMHTSFWDLTASSGIGRYLARLRPQMIPDSALDSLKKEQVRHAAGGKTVRLGSQASDMYPGDGPASLTDGVRAQLDHTDPAWLGFLGDDLVATIDLGAPTDLAACEVSFLQNVRLGIFLPSRVEVSAGQEPGHFEPLATILPRADEKEPGPFRETFAAKNLRVRARFVRIRAANRGTIPAWHPAAGRKAWLFVDEVAVNPMP
jgi:hypothetical protein